MGPVDVPTTTSTGQSRRLAGTSLLQRSHFNTQLLPETCPGPQTEAGRRVLPHGPAAVSSGRSRRQAVAPVERQGEEAVRGQPASRESGTARHSPSGGRRSSRDQSHRAPGRRNTVRAGRTPKAAPSHRPAALSPAGEGRAQQAAPDAAGGREQGGSGRGLTSVTTAAARATAPAPVAKEEPCLS